MDHVSSTPISCQTTLSTMSIVWLNPRLVRASPYLQQYSLEIRHKLGKFNSVPNPLSRLTVKPLSITEKDTEDKALEDLLINSSLVTIFEADDKLLEHTRSGYDQDL
jgi:hypothetical protein